MLKYLQLVILIVILPGCVSLQFKPPLGSLYKVHKLGVVAMETQPLEITRLSDEFAKNSVTDEKTFDNMISKDGEWVPTTVLAQEAAKQITLQGKYEVVLLPGLQKFVGIDDRSRTFFGENWQAPIRDWYNKETTDIDYSLHKKQGVDVVVEIGLSNYTVIGARLLLQVCVKLIDVETGHVIGKTRAYDYPVVESDLFSDKGQKFKYVVSFLAAKLLNEDLRYLGLVP